MTETVATPKYIDDITVRDLYVETVQAVARLGGAVTIEFCVNRLSQDLPIRALSTVPVARIAMAPALVPILRDQLNNILEQASQSAALAQAPAASPAKN